jgi:hypothetical protein
MIATRPILMEDMLIHGQQGVLTREEAARLYNFIVHGEAVYKGNQHIASLWFLEISHYSLMGQAVFTDEADTVMLAIVRQVRSRIKELSKLGYHRFEMRVQADFKKALKWAALIGFVQEGVMRAYDADRNDYILLARVE